MNLRCLKAGIVALLPALALADGPEAPEFRLRLGTNAWVSASEMRATNVTEKGVETTVVWKGHPLCGADFTVTGTVRREAKGLFTYRFSWTGCRSAELIESVEYPIVTVPVVAQEMRFVYPAATGCTVVKDLGKYRRGDEILDEWSVRTRPFHFTAALDESGKGPSHYIDQRGAREWATEIHVRSAGQGKIALASTYTMPVSRETTTAYELPFSSAYRRLSKPSWYEAAATYRDYLKTEEWYKAARKRDLGKLPDIGLWFWNRGLIDDVIPPVEEVKRRAGIPVALDWYWWHHNPYDTDYPFYWPPREGEEAFKAAVDRLNRQGIFTQTYVNGQMWDMDGHDCDWETYGAPAIRMKRDGTFRWTAWCVFNHHRLTSLCSESPYFQGQIRKVVRNLAQCGLPSQYLDCMGNGAYGECWNTNHVHALGGGNHAVLGWRKFMEDIKADNPGLQLSTEEPSEGYLGICDSFICVVAAYERYAGEGRVKRNFLPVMSALYHGVGAFFGGCTMLDGTPPWDPRWPDEWRWKKELDWPRLFPDQFAAEFGRSIAWGIQPMVHNCKMENLNDPRLREDVDFMIRGAKFYHANRDLLFFAEMRDPGEMQVAAREVKFMNRSVYTKQGEYKVALNTLPAVMHSVWQGKDKVEAVLVNWTREAQPYRLVTPDGAAEGTAPARSCERVTLRRGL